MTRRRPSYPGVWWLSPPGAVLMVVPLTLGLAVAYSDSDFRTYFRTPKSLTTETAMLFGGGALCLVIGALALQLGRRPSTRPGLWPWFDDVQLRSLRRMATPLYAATLLGYLSFVLAGARNDVRAVEVWEAVVRQNVASGNLEERIGTVAGLTTLTQVGVAYATVATLLLLHRRERVLIIQLSVLVLLTSMRAYVFTERLALIEVAVPVLALLAFRGSQSVSYGRRLLLRLAPLPLVLLLVLGFAASEYSRSYQFYKTRTDDSLVEFSSKRLSGYYATAYNNGQLLLVHDRYLGRLPYTSVEAVWTAPGPQDVDMYNRLVNRDRASDYQGILAGYGNLEFNNPGGLAAPLVDFGRAAGLLVLLGIGVAVGLAYRGFAAGHPAAVLLYPVSVTALFELPRFLYWTLGRTAPVLLALLVVAWVLHRSTRYRPTLAT